MAILVAATHANPRSSIKTKETTTSHVHDTVWPSHRLPEQSRAEWSGAEWCREDGASRLLYGRQTGPSTWRDGMAHGPQWGREGKRGVGYRFALRTIRAPLRVRWINGWMEKQSRRNAAPRKSNRLGAWFGRNWRLGVQNTTSAVFNYSDLSITQLAFPYSK